MGYVWIGGNGRPDSHILKFTKDGEFVAQFGKKGARMQGTNGQGQPNFVRDSHDQESFGRVAKVTVDPRENEVYVSDGYFNKARGRARCGERADEALLGRVRE